MPTLSPVFAQAFARAWIDAWNRHDLAAVLSHYAEDFVFSSPLINDIAGEASGTLLGKEAVGAYWTLGLRRIPDLRFELVDTLCGVDSLTLYYRGHRGMVAETFQFGADGKVARAQACYACQSAGEGKS